MNKICKICSENRVISEFSRLKSNKDGYLNLCKNCDAKRRNKSRVYFKNNFKLSNTQKAYLAGFTDGEGYVGLAKTIRKRGKYQGNACYYSRMIIASTSNDIYKIQKIYGFGKIYLVKSKHKRHKDRCDWVMCSNEIRIILPQIKGFLNIKKEQANLLLEYLSLFRTRDDNYRNSAELIYQKLKILNKRGI